MRIDRPFIAFVIMLALMGATAAAELPAQNKKAKPPDPAKHCNVAGSPGILGPNGVCVRMSGYISAGFGGGPVGGQFR